MPEQYHAKQWLQFQTTTQGPVLQGVFHWAFVESNPEARASYVKNSRRVLQVLNDELIGKKWLVGGKCSAADLSYVPFHSKLDFIMREAAPDVEKDFMNVDAWFVLPQLVMPLFKPIGSPEMLSRDSRAPSERISADLGK